MTPAGLVRSSPSGSRSGCDHSESRRSIPTASPTRRHSSEASRARRGRSSRPTIEAKACSAAPPVARRRSHVSPSLAAVGRRSPTAAVTHASTQPSMRASRVSSRPRAASLTLVTLGPMSPPDSISCSFDGSWSAEGSRFAARSSMPEVSIRMPRAYSSTVASRRARSHGAPANSRTWAASRAARNTCTSWRGSSSSSAKESTAFGQRAAVPSSANGTPTSEAKSTAGASLPRP